MFHVFQAMKHLNDNILESSHKKTIHGDLVNCKGMISAIKMEQDKNIKKETKGVDDVGDSIFHPP